MRTQRNLRTPALRKQSTVIIIFIEIIIVAEIIDLRVILGNEIRLLLDVKFYKTSFSV